jgi:hypothetical protein
VPYGREGWICGCGSCLFSFRLPDCHAKASGNSVSDVGRAFEGLLTYSKSLQLPSLHPSSGAAKAAALTAVQPRQTSIVRPATHVTMLFALEPPTPSLTCGR